MRENNGTVQTNPSSIFSGSNIEIIYDGFLCEYDDIYVHYGSSYLNEWANISDVKMIKNNNVFSSIIKVPQGNKLNLTFRSENYIWDNNEGNNYSFKIRNN